MYNILVCVLSIAIPEDFSKIMLLSVIKCKFTKEVFAGLVDKLFLGKVLFCDSKNNNRLKCLYY